MDTWDFSPLLLKTPIYVGSTRGNNNKNWKEKASTNKKTLVNIAGPSYKRRKPLVAHAITSYQIFILNRSNNSWKILFSEFSIWIVCVQGLMKHQKRSRRCCCWDQA